MKFSLDENDTGQAKFDFIGSDVFCVFVFYCAFPESLSASASLTGLNLLIADNKPEGVTVDLPISSSFRVESVAITVSATHLYRGDMVFSVISPAGTQVRMTGGVRYLDSNSNLDNVTFTTPFLWGESSSGTWQVKAADEWVVLSGRLKAASITV